MYSSSRYSKKHTDIHARVSKSIEAHAVGVVVQTAVIVHRRRRHHHGRRRAHRVFHLRSLEEAWPLHAAWIEVGVAHRVVRQRVGGHTEHFRREVDLVDVDGGVGVVEFLVEVVFA